MPNAVGGSVEIVLEEVLAHLTGGTGQVERLLGCHLPTCLRGITFNKPPTGIVVICSFSVHTCVRMLLGITYDMHASYGRYANKHVGRRRVPCSRVHKEGLCSTLT